MAVSFYSQQFSGDTCYTSQLQEFDIQTSANSGDVMTQYDITHTRSYEEQTPVLPLNEALHFAEFLTSPSVCLYVNRVLHPILITDYKEEVSDHPGEGSSIKLEFMAK